MIKCSYLKIRQKKGEIYYYCTNKRHNVNKWCYRECEDKKYKLPKPIKKVSKKKITVSEETYRIVYERDKGICQLHDKKCQGRIEAHHILYRSQRKDLIDEPTNLILLCTYHHKLVHRNKKKWQPILREMIK